MTDRLTTVEVTEKLGQAANPPLSAAGRARRSFLTTLDEERQSLDGSQYSRIIRFGGSDWIPRPVNATRSQRGAIDPSEFVGSMWFAPEPMLPAHLLLRCGTFTAAQDLTVALYQCANGQSGAALLLSSATVSVAAAGILDFAMTPHIQKGLYHLWFATDPAFVGNTYTAFAGIAMPLLNSPFASIPSDLHPTTYVTDVAATDPLPASIDLTIAGGRVADVGNSNVSLIHRFTT